METRLLSTAHEVGEEILLSSLCLAEHPRSLTIVSKTFSQIVFILHPWQGFHQRRFGRGGPPSGVVFWGFPRAESSPSAHLRKRDHERNGWYLSLIFWDPPPPQALSSPPVMLCCAECSPGFALFLEILGSTWIWKIKIQALKVLEFC